jgi:hypothetical protein
MDFTATSNICNGLISIPACFDGDIIFNTPDLTNGNTAQIVVILDGRMSVYSDTVILGQVRFTPDFTIYNLPINVQIIEGLNSYTFNLYPFPNNVGDTINDVVIS